MDNYGENYINTTNYFAQFDEAKKSQDFSLITLNSLLTYTLFILSEIKPQLFNQLTV